MIEFNRVSEGENMDIVHKIEIFWLCQASLGGRNDESRLVVQTW